MMMSFVTDISKGFSSIPQIEKLAIFCFTIIACIVIIKWPNNSETMLMYVFSFILYFVYLGFHRFTNTYSNPDKKNPKLRVDIQETGFNFQGNDNHRIANLKTGSYLLLIFAIVMTFINILIP